MATVHDDTGYPRGQAPIEVRLDLRAYAAPVGVAFQAEAVDLEDSLEGAAADQRGSQDGDDPFEDGVPLLSFQETHGDHRHDEDVEKDGNDMVTCAGKKKMAAKI